MSGTCNKGPGRGRAGMAHIAAAFVVGVLALTSTATSAQDLVHRFIDPSFGGNPFNSDHLLAIATIDRPAAPTTPSTTQTQEELIAQQLRAQLLSQLSGNILDQIQNAAVGATGNFEFGNQQVSYARTATGTTVTFTNTTTGAVNTVVLPAAGAASSASSSATAALAGRVAVASSESLLTQQALGSGFGNLTAAPVGVSSSSARSAELALLASSATSGGGSALPPY